MADNSKKSNPTPSSQKSEIWELESGKWQQESSGKGFKLVETNTGQKVSNHLTNADLQVILNLPKHPENEDWLYPPEFKHCTETGEELRRQDLSEEKAWIPPFGVLPINEREKGVVRGLNQSDFGLDIKNLFNRNEDDEPDFKIDRPPPKPNYQFLSVKTNSQENFLVALSSLTADLYLYTPVKNKWVHLEPKGELKFAPTEMVSDSWRCEAITTNNVTELFIPTDLGLASLKIDILTLQYDVAYFGDAKCCASPIYFSDSIMFLVQSGADKIELKSFWPRTGEIKTLEFQDITNIPKLNNIRAPISTTSFVAWLCDEGQITLRTRIGIYEFELSFLRWPVGYIPDFNMGCPYLNNKDGDLYQLCFEKDSPKYVQINSKNPTIEDGCNGQRICSGSYNFHLSKKNKTAPWSEDGVLTHQQTLDTSIEYIWPMMESSVSSFIFALKFDLSGSQEVLSSMFSLEKQRCELVSINENDTKKPFCILFVAEPYKTQFFIYEKKLCVYHPEFSDILQWSLNNENS